MRVNSSGCDKISNDCEMYDPFYFPDICFLFHLKILDFLAQLQPPITQCPLRKVVKHPFYHFLPKLLSFQGSYKQEAIVFDMTPLSALVPALKDAYVKLQISLDVVTPKPRNILCITYDYSARLVRKREG
jgi:hypothetical protein